MRVDTLVLQVESLQSLSPGVWMVVVALVVAFLSPFAFALLLSVVYDESGESGAEHDSET